MNKPRKREQQGYSLVELLLVAVIMGSLVVLFMNYQRTKARRTFVATTAAEMQQILAAAMAYYVSNPPNPTTNPTQGGWPPPDLSPGHVGAISCLQGIVVPNCLPTTPRKYLPNYLTASDANVNSVRPRYTIGVGMWSKTLANLPSEPTFYLWAKIDSRSGFGRIDIVSQEIANQLPMAYTTSAQPIATNPGQLPVSPGSVDRPPCTANSNSCYVVTGINAPAQVLNRNTSGASGAATSPAIVRFAGVYKHGGCVPVPTCPGDTPRIYVVPTSVSGLSQSNGTVDPNTLYGIVSFSAYATASAPVTTTPASGPAGCNNAAATPCNPAGAPEGTPHWRVCLQVITDQGVVSGTGWGQYVDLLAFTRCSPATGELTGSPTSIFSPN